MRSIKYFLCVSLLAIGFQAHPGLGTLLQGAGQWFDNSRFSFLDVAVVMPVLFWFGKEALKKTYHAEQMLVPKASLASLKQSIIDHLPTKILALPPFSGLKSTRDVASIARSKKTTFKEKVDAMGRATAYITAFVLIGGYIWSREALTSAVPNALVSAVSSVTQEG